MFEETANLTNHFLIAMPNLPDPHFFQTVTFICMHNEEGAMGIIINRPLSVELGDVLGHMKIEPALPDIGTTRIYEGGPVQRERGFVLHRPIGKWETMITVGTDIGVTVSRDILESIAKGEGPPEMLIALGYAGWTAGQLEEEMASNTWLSVPADADIIFNTPAEKRWQTAAKRLGVDLHLLSMQAGHG